MSPGVDYDLAEQGEKVKLSIKSTNINAKKLAWITNSPKKMYVRENSFVQQRIHVRNTAHFCCEISVVYLGCHLMTIV